MNVKIQISVCRVCLQSGDGISLFEDTFSEQYHYTTQLEVNRDDGLPETLCKRCIGRLKIAFDFKKQCEASEEHLKSFILQVNKKFSQSIKTNKTNIDDEQIEQLLENDYPTEDTDSKTDVKSLPTPEIEHYETDSTLRIKDDIFEEEVVLEYDENAMDMDNIIIEAEDDQLLEEEHLSDSVDIEENYVDTKHREKKYREDRTMHICTKCNKDFSTNTNLLRHLQTHDGSKPFQCTICGNGFTQNGSLKQHMHIHTGERPFKCHVCDRAFTQSKSLKSHMRRHTGEKPYFCVKCGQSFRQRDGLKRHEMIKHTSAEFERFQCDLCNKTLQSKYSLNMHYKKHIPTIEPEFKCDTCDRAFSTKGSLTIHTRQHTGERPFKCPYCERIFARKGAMLTHSKQHGNKKPFKCKICKQEFPETNEFSEHMTKHFNEPIKRYKCEQCMKSFSIKRNLLIHLQNHRAETIIYKCEDCAIGFNTKRGLKLHRHNQHKEHISDLNECDICCITFITVTDLNAHMLSTHDNIHSKCIVCHEEFFSKKLYEEHMLDHELSTIT